MDTMEIIRLNIRKLLKEKKWTQAYLAERIGIQSNYISDILVGKRGDKMKIPFAESISEAFGITINDLLTQNLETDIKNGNYNNILSWIKSLYSSDDERKKIWFEVEFEKNFPEYLEWLNKRDKKREDDRKTA